MKFFLAFAFLILSLNRALSVSSKTSHVDTELHTKVAAGEAGEKKYPQSIHISRNNAKTKEEEELAAVYQQRSESCGLPGRVQKNQYSCKYKKNLC